MLLPNELILFLVLPGNNPINEEETICCINSWRNMGGDFKDIPIYVINPTKKGISNSTRLEIKSYNADYMHVYMKEIEKFKSNEHGNAIVVGMWLEDTLCKGKVILYIESHLWLLKPPMRNLFSLNEKPLLTYEANFILSKACHKYYTNNFLSKQQDVDFVEHDILIGKYHEKYTKRNIRKVQFIAVHMHEHHEKYIKLWKLLHKS